MSNIPKARRILTEAIAGDNSYDSTQMYGAIVEALEHLNRKKPAFRAKARTNVGLSEFGERQARALREGGMAVSIIAAKLSTNMLYVSKAINA